MPGRKRNVRCGGFGSSRQCLKMAKTSPLPDTSRRRLSPRAISCGSARQRSEIHSRSRLNWTRSGHTRLAAEREPTRPAATATWSTSTSSSSRAGSADPSRPCVESKVTGGITALRRLTIRRRPLAHISMWSRSGGASNSAQTSVIARSVLPNKRLELAGSLTPHFGDQAMRRFLPFAVAVGMLMPALASAQRQGDVDAINRLIDRYGALEDAMDMNGQAQLMSADRVWIAQGGGRRTDQATNMRIQQAAFH